MNQKIVVCLPTYNEAENISSLINAVQRKLPEASVLVIDDNSPDGTGNTADSVARTDPRVRVLHRPCKSGLGSAYCDGFRFAIEQMRPDLIVQMDADFSHNPNTLPSMISSAGQADLVIGSRYVAGGGTVNWNFARQMISRFGSLYARSILQLPVYDPTGGFKVWRRELLQQVLTQPIASGGYVFQVETTFYAYRMGAAISEIPIRFVERSTGKSKMTLSIAFEAFRRIPMIRFRHKVMEKG